MASITITIHNGSDQPLYEQIVQQVRQQVFQGVLRDGDQLPSIRALARDLRVSIITTKRAYEELEREGLLSVSTGRGTFVRAKGIEASRQNRVKELEQQMNSAAGQALVLGLAEADFIRMASEQYRLQTPNKL